MSDNSQWEVRHRDFIVTLRIGDLTQIIAEVRREGQDKCLHHDQVAVETSQWDQAAAFRGDKLAPSQTLVRTCEKWIDQYIATESEVLAELVRYRKHKHAQKRKKA